MDLPKVPLSVPETGWNDEPDVADRSPQASLVRIKLSRNHLFHLGSEPLSKDQFEGDSLIQDPRFKIQDPEIKLQENKLQSNASSKKTSSSLIQAPRKQENKLQSNSRSRKQAPV